MKAITVRQPWAQLLVTPDPGRPDQAVKWIQTRPRSTSYRGRIAIHAATRVANLNEGGKAWNWFRIDVFMATRGRKGGPACSGSGTCDPIPAKGQLSVPWNWELS